MERKNMIDFISNKIIPIDITYIYNYILEIMNQLSNDYYSIKINSDVNSNRYGDISYLKSAINEKNNEKNKIREKENELIIKKRKYQDKLSNAITLSISELNEYNSINNRLNELHKQEQEITRSLYTINKSIQKKEDERTEAENIILESKERINKNIKKLQDCIQTINELNLGIERLNCFEVKPKHITEIHNFMENVELYNDDSNLLVTESLYDSLFINGIDLRISFYKGIYNEAVHLLDTYKNRNELDFSNIEQLVNIKNMKVEEIGNIYSPTNQKWNYESTEFLQTYVELIEAIKNTIDTEPTKEQIIDLKSKWDKLIKEDVQYFTYNIHALGNYINNLANKYLKNKKNLTL